jgi:hypothetical protein
VIIYHNPDEWESIVTTHTCDYHRKHPGENFAGCTCSAQYLTRRKDQR